MKGPTAVGYFEACLKTFWCIYFFTTCFIWKKTGDGLKRCKQDSWVKKKSFFSDRLVKKEFKVR